MDRGKIAVERPLPQGGILLCQGQELLRQGSYSLAGKLPQQLGCHGWLLHRRCGSQLAGDEDQSGVGPTHRDACVVSVISVPSVVTPSFVSEASPLPGVTSQSQVVEDTQVGAGLVHGL